MIKKNEYNVKLKCQIAKEGRVHRWVAGQLGLSPAMISNFINGSRTPNQEQKKELAKVLNCKVNDIFLKEN